jgi:hypothetical protein
MEDYADWVAFIRGKILSSGTGRADPTTQKGFRGRHHSRLPLLDGRWNEGFSTSERNGWKRNGNRERRKLEAGQRSKSFLPHMETAAKDGHRACLFPDYDAESRYELSKAS